MSNGLLRARGLEHERQIVLFRLAFAVVVLYLAYNVGQLLVQGRYGWLAGVVALGILGLVWMTDRFEVAVILYLVVTLFWEIGIGRGTERLGEVRIGHGFLLLIVIILLYHFRRLADSPSAVWGSRAQRSDLAWVAWLSGLYLITLLISLMANESGGWAFTYWLFYGVRGCLLLVLMQRALRSERAIGTFMVLLLFLGAFLSLSDNLLLLSGKGLIPFSLGYAYEELPSPTEITKAGLRLLHVRSAFGDPGFGGAFMAALLPIALVHVRRGKLFARAVFATISSSIIINIVAYVDRGTWVGVLVSLGVMGVILRRRQGLTVGIVLLGLWLAAGLTHASVAGNVSNLADLGRQLLLSDRWALWASTLSALPHFPLLLGTGFRNADVFVATVLSSPVEIYKWVLSAHGRSYVQPHNSYLDLLIKAGIPVFLLFMALTGYVNWLAVRAVRATSRSSSVRLLLIAAMAGLAAFATEAFFDRTLFVFSLNVVFWLYLGTVYGLAMYLLRLADRNPSDVSVARD